MGTCIPQTFAYRVILRKIMGRSVQEPSVKLNLSSGQAFCGKLYSKKKRRAHADWKVMLVQIIRMMSPWTECENLWPRCTKSTDIVEQAHNEFKCMLRRGACANQRDHFNIKTFREVIFQSMGSMGKHLSHVGSANLIRTMRRTFNTYFQNLMVCSGTTQCWNGNVTNMTTVFREVACVYVRARACVGVRVSVKRLVVYTNVINKCVCVWKSVFLNSCVLVRAASDMYHHYTTPCAHNIRSVVGHKRRKLNLFFPCTKLVCMCVSILGVARTTGTCPRLFP